jgi:hypothetical protein
MPHRKSRETVPLKKFVVKNSKYVTMHFFCHFKESQTKRYDLQGLASQNSVNPVAEQFYSFLHLYKSTAMMFYGKMQ